MSEIERYLARADLEDSENQDLYRETVFCLVFFDSLGWTGNVEVKFFLEVGCAEIESGT